MSKIAEELKGRPAPEANPDPRGHQDILNALRVSQARTDQLESLVAELRKQLSEKPRVLIGRSPSNAISVIAGITIGLIAVCVIGVTSVTLTSQDMLIEQLMKRGTRYERASIIPADFRTATAEEFSGLALALITGSEPAGAPAAVSYWEAEAPLSLVLEPMNRDEAIEAAFEAALPALL